MKKLIILNAFGLAVAMEYADIARQIGKLDEDQLDPIENRVLDFDPTT
jgi:hypothetical protein